MKKLTAEWVEKAEEDYKAARRLIRGKEPLNNTACFHCQQAGEKYLKALMQEWGRDVPYTHDLLQLLDALVAQDRTLRSLRRALTSLNRYGVDYRYPGRRASKRQADATLRHATQVRCEIRKKLGLPTRSPRTK
jgi:HEPN domain-containing protein